MRELEEIYQYQVSMECHCQWGLGIGVHVGVRAEPASGKDTARAPLSFFSFLASFYLYNQIYQEKMAGDVSSPDDDQRNCWK